MEFGGRKLSILIYHRVLPEADPLQPDLPTAEQFRRHMRWLGRTFNVLALDDAVQRLYGKNLPPRATAITFDDGYADNHDVALPILRELGLPATFFIATGFLNGGRMWNDTVIETVRRWQADTLSFEPLGIERLPMASTTQRQQAINVLLAALKHRPFDERIDLVNSLAGGAAEFLDSPMMTSEQVRALRRAGMTVGGHTRWHPILTVLRDEEAYAEIQDGKHDLEAILGEPVELFAYPNGRPEQDYATHHTRMVEELGFVGAVTTARGTAGYRSNPYQLPRFTPWDRATPRFLARLVHSRQMMTDHLVTET